MRFKRCNAIVTRTLIRKHFADVHMLVATNAPFSRIPSSIMIAMATGRIAFVVMVALHPAAKLQRIGQWHLAEVANKRTSARPHFPAPRRAVTR